MIDINVLTKTNKFYLNLKKVNITIFVSPQRIIKEIEIYKTKSYENLFIKNIIKISNHKLKNKSKNVDPFQNHFELNINVVLLTIINPIINKTQSP
jgi:hypothetical protein